MKRERVFNWQFIVALIALVAVCYLAVAGLQNAADVRASGHRADLLIERLRIEEHDAAMREQANDLVRQRLLTTQSELLHKYSKLETSQKRLLRWLRRHGIQVPVSYVTVPKVGKVHHTRVVHSLAPAPSPKPPVKVRQKHSGAHHGTSTAPGQNKAPGHSAGHGNSDNAPGHLKR